MTGKLKQLSKGLYIYKGNELSDYDDETAYLCDRTFIRDSGNTTCILFLGSYSALREITLS